MLPIPGPRLISGLIQAYTYNAKIKASSNAKGTVLEVG